jgi:hypothetical protein
MRPRAKRTREELNQVFAEATTTRPVRNSRQDEEADDDNRLAPPDSELFDAVVEEEAPEYFKPKSLPSRKSERKRLGKVEERSKCFFCSHKGERNTTLPSDDVDTMVEMMRQNTGRMDTGVLAEMIAEYYADFRRKINGQLNRGEMPLAPMSAATVAEHIRRHHQDPEVKQIVILEELQEIREELMDVIFEKNSKTKYKRGNKVQIDNLDKIIKLELLVQGRDASKMAGYSAGARVNPTIHKQGPVATTTKSLLDFWRRGGTQ